jgi:hypothetical protein
LQLSWRYFANPLRVALAAQKRLQDEHARHARDVPHRLGQLDVLLLQRLLDVLDRLGRVADEHVALPEVAAQHAHFVGRPKRRCRQP